MVPKVTLDCGSGGKFSFIVFAWKSVQLLWHSIMPKVKGRFCISSVSAGNITLLWATGLVVMLYGKFSQYCSHFRSSFCQSDGMVMVGIEKNYRGGVAFITSFAKTFRFVQKLLGVSEQIYI
jgi:hypothetical protein